MYHGHPIVVVHRRQAKGMPSSPHRHPRPLVCVSVEARACSAALFRHISHVNEPQANGRPWTCHGSWHGATPGCKKELRAGGSIAVQMKRYRSKPTAAVLIRVPLFKHASGSRDSARMSSLLATTPTLRVFDASHVVPDVFPRNCFCFFNPPAADHAALPLPICCMS